MRLLPQPNLTTKAQRHQANLYCSESKAGTIQHRCLGSRKPRALGARLNGSMDYLASDAALSRRCEKIFQGPIADALTHVGQLAMPRRLAGRSVRGENYFKAEIEIGRVGPEQSAKRMEFDHEIEKTNSFSKAQWRYWYESPPCRGYDKHTRLRVSRQ